MALTRLTAGEIEKNMKPLPDWALKGRVIKRKIPLPDFKSGVHLIKKIAGIAEMAGHHPDITLSWGSLVVSTTTHSSGGLTKKDFSLAHSIERLLHRRSGSQGTAKKKYTDKKKEKRNY